MIITNDLENIIADTKQSDERIHPWRICPIDKHFVKKHIEHIPPSKEHPNGQIIERREHCALNPSNRKYLLRC